MPKTQKMTPCDEADSDPQSIVALRQGRHMLTTFHPELTKDSRFHEYFVRTCVLPTLS
jgi:5'-phosphate synthase pdxT subunit